MSIRFLADEDLDSAIIEGLRSREPAIDLLDAKRARLRGIGDPAILEIAAQEGRIVLSHDRNTMTGHFKARLLAGQSHPGLFIIPQRAAIIGTTIESLVLVWAASEASEWRNRIVFLPDLK